jgi:4-amino-4-deoxy-L-arabinose transferase-like glycosyltransferase
MDNKPYYYLWALLGSAILVYAVGLTIDVMDIDAAQYASIALEMLTQESFLQITDRGNNYLDKPPLLFWLSALFYNIMGVGTVAYKAPSVLFSLLTFFSTYKLARFYYSKEVAILSVIITASCQAFFMINQDCRTDTILTGGMMFAIYQLVYYLNTKKAGYFFGAFIGLSIAMLSKGPIGFVLPIAIVGLDLVLKGQWNAIFSFRWVWGVIIILIVLSPMCWGLYQQYGVEGLRFYFWDQSFGRLTGQNSFVKNISPSDYINDPFFFYHTFMWMYAPWSILFVFGLAYKIRDFVVQKGRLLSGQEVITWGGFILGFFMMSMSMYKLPHYIVMVLPLASVCTADFLVSRFKGQIARWLTLIHAVLMVILWFICFYLVGYSFSDKNEISIVLALILFLLTIGVFVKTEGIKRMICILSLTIISGNFLLNYHVYPRLLKYQSGSVLGKYIHAHHIDRHLYNYTPQEPSLDFYAQQTVTFRFWDSLNAKSELKAGYYCIVDEPILSQIASCGIKYDRLLITDSYRVSLLTPEFLNPSTRKTVLQKHALIRIRP